MSKRLRRLLLIVALLALGAGCAHRSDPAANLLRLETAAAPEAEFVFTLLPRQTDLFIFEHPSAPPERVYRGQVVFITVRTNHPAADATPPPDSRLEMEVRKPGLLRPIERSSVAAGTLLRFGTTDRDPLGDYTLTLRLIDTASGRTSTVNHTLRVEAYRTPTLAEGFDPQTWLTHYYLQPTPDLALPALRELHLQLPANKRPGALPPLLGFYDQVLRDNPWLLPAFSERLAVAAPDEAYLLSLVLGFHFRHATDAKPAELDPAVWTRLADFRAYDWPADPDAPLADITQLDALWGRFFAAGRYADLQTLLTPLAHHADLGAAERWQPQNPAAPNPGADLNGALADAPPEVKRDLLLRTAIWSLRSNARQHPLVRTYLEYTLASGELPPPAHELLNRILQPESAN